MHTHTGPCQGWDTLIGWCWGTDSRQADSDPPHKPPIDLVKALLPHTHRDAVCTPLPSRTLQRAHSMSPCRDTYMPTHAHLHTCTHAVFPTCVTREEREWHVAQMVILLRKFLFSHSWWLQTKVFFIYFLIKADLSGLLWKTVFTKE